MGKNSPRRFYRNYDEAAITTSLFLPPDPAFPGIAPLTSTDSAPAGIKTRGTFVGPSLLAYPESTYPTNLRKSVSSTGAANGLLLEGNKPNYIYGAVDFATSGQAVNWVQSGMTGAGSLTEIGPDGQTSAVLLTATGVNGSITLSRGAIGAGTRRFTVWLKRKTGSQPVSIQVVSGTVVAVTASLVTYEWRRFEITATTGQATCGIIITGPGDQVCAYAPGLYLATYGRSSTSLPQSQITSSFEESLNGAFPSNTPRPMKGATALLRVAFGSDETGFYNVTGGSVGFNKGTDSQATFGLSSHDGEVQSYFTFDKTANSASIAFVDNIYTSTEIVENAASLSASEVTVAIAMTNGAVRVTSDFALPIDPIVFNNAGFVFDDASFTAPSVSMSVGKGSCYVKSLAVWPFYIDNITSLVNNFR